MAGGDTLRVIDDHPLQCAQRPGQARNGAVGPDRDVDRGSDGFRIVLVEFPADHSLRRDPRHQDDDRHAA
jgi:hypothetical protein